jgi:hypothetical protein
MSGTINSSDDSIESCVEAWIQKYDEEAEHLLRGQESAREAVRDFGTEHAAYLKARGEVEEQVVGEPEVVVDEKEKTEMTKEEKTRDGKAKNGKAKEEKANKKAKEEKANKKVKEEKRQETNGKADGKADEEKKEEKANKGKWWNFLDGRMSRLGLHKDEE